MRHFFVMIGPLALLATAGRPCAQRQDDPPRLVVMVAIDQMIPEQLDRLAPLFNGGLGRFARAGHVWHACELQYGATQTGPGHATFATGTNPARHGIVANQWFPLESGTAMYCVRDEDVEPLTVRGLETRAAYQVYRNSPKTMRRPSLGDHVKAAHPASRVVSISGKDRAAVAMGGHHADLALWWDRVSGGFMSSSWYAERLPEWVAGFNGTWSERYHSAEEWAALPMDLTGSGADADDREGETPYQGRRALPHRLPPLPQAADAEQLAAAAAAVYGSPLSDAFVVELAREAVVRLDLGAGEVPDVLLLSLSACDTVGHSFGPYSREVTDVLLRADLELGRLFDLLDERLGPDGWAAAMSADHGVLALPEALAARGVGAVRVGLRRVNATLGAMRESLKSEYGEDFVLAADGTRVRFSERAIRARDLEPADVRRAAARALMDAGAEWLEAVWTSDELRASRADGALDGWKSLWVRGFDAERTADLILQARPWHLVSWSPTGTSHGSPYLYDRRIPLAFLGRAFTPKSSFEPVSSTHAVPTLLDLLGLPIPDGLDGRSLISD
jgi:predicted AlkP superfamily pyrophosphatase or phosphodiesterase